MIRIELGHRQLKVLSEHKKVHYKAKVRGVEQEVELTLSPYICLVLVDDVDEHIRQKIKDTPKSNMN
jgi:hypothetical protein